MEQNRCGIARRAALGLIAAAAAAGSSKRVLAAGPIKVGFSMQLTGALAASGKAALSTALMWAEEVNEAGGLMGRPVELVYYDDQSNPGLVPQIVSKLLDVDKVDLLISNTTNNTAPAMPLVVQKKGLMMAMFALAVNDQFKYPNYFQIQPFDPHGKAAAARGFFEAAMTKSDPISTAL